MATEAPLPAIVATPAPLTPVVQGVSSAPEASDKQHSDPGASTPPTTTRQPPKLVESATPPAPPTGGASPPASGPVPLMGDPVKGAWSSVLDWPLIAIHAALLPDGRVMTYGTQVSTYGTGTFMYDVFDPREVLGSPASHLTLPNGTTTNLFCSAQLLLPTTGELMLSGGDRMENGKSTSRGVADVNIFSTVTNQMRPASSMQRGRWYGTSTVLPNGEIYLQGGTDGEDHPEIRGNDGNFRLLNGIDTLRAQPNGDPYFDNNYPRNFVGPNGKIFGFDHYWMYEVDPHGIGDNGNPGSVKMFASHWDVPTADGRYIERGWAASSSAVMLRPGKILQLGGIRPNATLIDISGPRPQLTELPPMRQTRQWANATLLADGKVFVSGGSTRNLLADPANEDVGEVAYDTEIFDPLAATWSQGAPLSVRRFYHSVALLLPDATILSSGGGSPGPVTNLNAQVYYPGYLFKSDGSRATRPVIDQPANALPMVVDAGESFSLTSPEAATIRRVTMVKTGSVTHSFDMDQRFVEPTFTRNGNRIDISLPPNVYETPPGFYMVFVIDQNGTPSMARMIRVNPSS